MAHDRNANYEDARILAYSLQSGARKEILAGGYFPRYLPSGYLVYFHAGTLFAAPFDVGRLEMTGQPAPILDGIVSYPGNATAEFAYSDTGAVIYLPGKAASGNMVVNWLDAQGKLQPLRNVPTTYYSPRFSPDGKRLALELKELATA